MKDLDLQYKELERKFSNFKGSKAEYDALKKKMDDLQDKIMARMRGREVE